MLGVVVLIPIVILALVVLFLLNFYRDPKRKIPEGDNIVSPADGKVIQILRIGEGEREIKKGFGKIRTLAKDVGKECYLISIFMNVFDVHINRAPVEGIIKYIRHEKGRFFNAADIEKSLQNEKNEILIKNNKIGNVKVIQIAGLLARKIKCFVKEKQKIDKGQKIGAILLGSQVSLIIPSKVKLKINVGKKVKAGKSIIAVY